MIKKIPVNLPEQRSYEIIIGHGLEQQVAKFIKQQQLGEKVVVVTHPALARQFAPALVKACGQHQLDSLVLTLPVGEQSKSQEQVFALINRIAAKTQQQRVVIVALGGGVIGDLSGFAAAIFRRGVPYIQMPTTLLAQIDSAIGGKTGIDLACGKNLVGCIYQPKAVFCDLDFLTTLPKRQLRNGMAEAIKYGIIADPILFKMIAQQSADILALKEPYISNMIARCAAIKARVVSEDEFDKKDIRAILNFGHTAGHALEAALGFQELQHGEAVALGMRIASLLSHRLGLLSLKDLDQINQVISLVGLPEYWQGVSLAKIWQYMRQDKKFIAGKNRFVLVKAIGDVIVQSAVNQALINASIMAYRQSSVKK